MARTHLVFGDIEGKLDVLRAECTRCSRKGRYSVRRLIAQYGRNGSMMKWKEQLNGDCPNSGCAAAARSLRRDLPRSAEGGIARRRWVARWLRQIFSTPQAKQSNFIGDQVQSSPRT